MEAVTLSSSRIHTAAVMVLTGLASVWAALAVLLVGGSPAGSVLWVLLGCGMPASAAGSLLAIKHSPGTVRWVGMLSFGMGVGVCVLALVLLHQA